MTPTTQGALWIIGGTSMIALSDNFVAGVAREIGLWQFHAMRSAMVVPVAGIFAVAIGQGRSLRPSAPGHVLLRSVFGMTGLMMYFAALPAVGIAQAAAGFFTAPVWIAVISALAFGERIGPRRIAAIVLGFVGVCLVLGIGAQPVRPMALVAVTGGIFWALNVIWVRRYCDSESAICLAVWQFLVLLGAGVVGLGLVPWLGGILADVPGAEFATTAWRVPGWGTVGAVFLIGLAGICATGCMAQGYRMGPASVMGLFDFSFLFWAPFFAWLVWDDVLDARTAGGMVLIMTAGALAIWSGRQMGQDAAPAVNHSN